MRKKTRLSNLTIGIVGIGNVGSKIVRLANIFGMKVLQNDPPRERVEGRGQFVDLSRILKDSDIITLHVPLTHFGEDKTFHLANDTFFQALKRNPAIINTSRGDVVKENTLMRYIRSGVVTGSILDVWVNEPNINMKLMELADISTPHIAGYSLEGKAKGAAYCVQQASRFFNFGIDNWYPEDLPSPADPLININPNNKTIETILHEAIIASYDIAADDGLLRQHPGDFEKIRNDYPVRREFPEYTVCLQSAHPEAEKILKALGFNVRQGDLDAGHRP
jgi:erythronate-4-phosphate dehydrogenase